MPQIRISDAARFLDSSDDTVRRLVQAGTLTEHRDPSGRLAIDGAELAAYLKAGAPSLPGEPDRRTSARNRFVGLVTAIKADGVMAQVDLQCGPFRVVSLMSSESVDDLGLEPGSIAVAVVKSTNVVIERENRP